MPKPNTNGNGLPRSKSNWSDKHYRSLMKSVSYRLTGTLCTTLISFAVTGQVKIAVSIGFIELFAKTGLYYVHERIWNRVSLGRTTIKEDYQI